MAGANNVPDLNALAGALAACNLTIIIPITEAHLWPTKTLKSLRDANLKNQPCLQGKTCFYLMQLPITNQLQRCDIDWRSLENILKK